VRGKAKAQRTAVPGSRNLAGAARHDRDSGLQKRLWPDGLVDVDHNLNTAINKIPEALGDSSDNPHFVEMLPRRGYRFIAPMDSDGNGAKPATITLVIWLATPRKRGPFQLGAQHSPG
jgi:hypothetical protein